MNLTPALRYQFGVFMKEAAAIMIAFVMFIALSFIFSVTVNTDSDSISFTGYGFMIAVFMFVMGIVNIRTNLRLCMQFGVSRRTTFLGELLVILSGSLLLSIAVQIFMAIERVLPGNSFRLNASDIYQIIFLRGTNVALTLGDSINSIMLNTSLMLALALFGMFFSLLFWRLSKFWTVAVVVAMVLLVNGVPLVGFRLGLDVSPFFRWMAASPINFVLFWLILAVVFAVVNWLLLRKANVKAAK